MGIDPPQDLLLNEFLRVDALFSSIIFRDIDAEAIIVEIRRKVAMGVPLAVVAIEVIDAVLKGTARCVKHAHAPLPHGGSGVTG